MAAKKIWIKIVLVLISLIAAIPINAFIFKLLVTPNKAEVVIENSTPLSIDRIDVHLCSDSRSLSNLNSGQTQSIEFPVAGDCSYKMTVRLANGQQLDTSFGYISGGSNFKDFVTIKEDQLYVGQQVMEPDPNYFWKTVGLFMIYVLIAAALYKISLFITEKTISEMNKTDV